MTAPGDAPTGGTGSTSNLKRRVAVLVAGILSALTPAAAATAASAKPSPPVGGSDDCGWRVTREYGPEQLTYRLHLALSGCTWWDGSARSLKVSVTRFDQDGARTARSAPAPCAIPPERRRAPTNAHCDASATVDHPEGETAHYRGEAEWEWSDGPRRVAFDTTCRTTSETVTCADGGGAQSARGAAHLEWARGDLNPHEVALTGT
jgi:hypothetical protein